MVSFIISLSFPVRIKFNFHRSHILVRRQNVADTATVVTGVVNSWSWYVLLEPILIYKPFLAGAPVGSSSIGNGRNTIHTVLIDFYSLAVMTGSWNVILNVGVDSFYNRQNIQEEKCTYRLL